jgi:GTP-binding protein EngB required for normal cell division
MFIYNILLKLSIFCVGETTALQFFTLGRHITTKQPTLVVTDMPGYGFAFMKQAEAKRCFFLVIVLKMYLFVVHL